MRCTFAASVIAVLMAAVAMPVAVTWADEADAFFDDSYVHEIRLYFDDPNWYNVLYNSHAGDPDDPYFPGRFEYGDTVIDPVGIRFKGNSSFSIPTVKKSFKIDIDEYDEENEELRFLGLKKLNLNNAFRDPTLLREKLFLDFASAYVPSIRAVHCRVYVNDVYWGLYTAVEQIDKTFVQDRFGAEEDGNLFKAQASDDGPPSGDFGSDLTWLGPDPEPYHDYYQLKTNEAEDDYSQLIEFIDVLNNVPTAELPAQIEPIFDVEGALYGMALNSLFVNLDSYIAPAHNFYLYDRDDTGRITHIHWDVNEAFGNFRMFLAPWEDPLELDPFWVPNPPPHLPPQPRPLASNLWAVDSYSRTYLRALARMLRSGFDVPTIEPRIDELADIIRADVYADTNKQYTNAQFEANLYNDVETGGPNGLLYGLRSFIQARAAYLNAHLDTLAAPSDLALNELMAVNVGTIQDGAGDFDPWVEIYNQGPGAVDMSGLHLTDDAGIPNKWPLPAGTLDDGEFLLIWLDGETGEGSNHANFTLQPTGGEVHLFNNTVPYAELIDSVTYHALNADESFGRFPDGNGAWQTMNIPTPGAANQENTEPTVLYINEFMADNDTTIEDPDDPDSYEDWIEIYNPGAEAVDLSGMFLTDDLTDLMQWEIPPGVTIPAGGYLIFWADDDTEQGDTHTNFKLGAGGEEIGLTDSDGVTLIDSVVFGAQFTDISYGRYPDGADNWGFMSPTPGVANSPLNAPPTITGTTHAPAVPTAADPVWVSATVTDDGAVAGVSLTYDAGAGPIVVEMFDDGLHEDGLADDDVFGGQIPALPQDTIVHYYVSATDNVGAESTDPAGAPEATYSYAVGYAPPPLFINEFMASNDTTIADEFDEYDDWIEIYNAGDDAIDMGGMYLTDDLAEPLQYAIPAGVTIEAGGFLLFWADSDDEQGPLHTNFKLGAGGEDIGLFDSDANGNIAIDMLTFGAQTTDISYGRLPDGGATWVFFDPATPGASNGDPGLAGDLNCDGSVDFDDIDPFVLALTGEAAYLAVYPDCRWLNADCDDDGDVDFDDIDAFVALLGG